MTQTKAELLETKHQGDIRLGDANSSHYVGLKAPATVSSSLVWTLPAADGSANYLLKTDGSGNLGWVADSTTDSTKMPLAGGIFTGDVTFDGETAGRDIVFDRSDNALEFADNAKAIFGASGDLEVYHDSGGDSFISESGGGALILRGDGLQLQRPNGNLYLKCIAGSRTEIYHNNVKTFETIGNGVLVQGTEGAAGHIYLYADEGDDNADKWVAAAATGGSLQIQNYSSGSWVDKLVINGSGNVGIGDSSPGNLLTVAGRTETRSITGHEGTNTDLQIASGHASSIISFSIGQYGVSASEKFRIGASGQLGIGGATYGTSGQVLTSGGSGSAPSWADAAGGGATPTVKTANYTAASGDMVVVNGTGLTITLPSSPSTGDSVAIRILGDRYATVARNSSNIESSATNYYVDIFDGYATFTYSDSTRGWLIGG